MFFEVFIRIISTIPDALRAKRQMNVDRLVTCFQFLILGWETATSVL